MERTTKSLITCLSDLGHRRDLSVDSEVLYQLSHVGSWSPPRYFGSTEMLYQSLLCCSSDLGHRRDTSVNSEILYQSLISCTSDLGDRRDPSVESKMLYLSLISCTSDLVSGTVFRKPYEYFHISRRGKNSVHIIIFIRLPLAGVRVQRQGCSLAGH